MISFILTQLERNTESYIIFSIQLNSLLNKAVNTMRDPQNKQSYKREKKTTKTRKLEIELRFIRNYL